MTLDEINSRKKQIDEDYRTLVQLKANSIYDDIRYEQDQYTTWDNLHIIGQLAEYIDKFHKSKNPSYIDCMVIFATQSGFQLTNTLQTAVLDAAMCRYEEKDRGGILEIKRTHFKGHALLTMFNLHHFLNISKLEASERAAYYIFTRCPKSKIKASSLCKAFNRYLLDNPTIESIKKFSEHDKKITIQKWRENLELYPLPPDGHEVLGK